MIRGLGSCLAAAELLLPELRINIVTPAATPTPPTTKPTMPRVLFVPDWSFRSLTFLPSAESASSLQADKSPPHRSLASSDLDLALRAKKVPAPRPTTPTPNAAYEAMRSGLVGRSTGAPLNDTP